jgi:hypothetical protein
LRHGGLGAVVAEASLVLFLTLRDDHETIVKKQPNAGQSHAS